MSEVGQHYESQSEEYKKLSAHYNHMSVSIKEMNDKYRAIS